MELSAKHKTAIFMAILIVIVLFIYSYNPREGMYSASQEFLEDSGLTEGHVLIGDVGYIYAVNDDGVIADGSVDFDFGSLHSFGFNRRYNLTVGENPLLPTNVVAEFDYKNGRMTIYDEKESTILFDGYYNNELNSN
jgi:hypothetical protein